MKAAEYAIKAHAGQTRKYTGRPYIEHPARVAMMVTLLEKTTKEMVAAAWLHDVVEDCGITVGEIYARFDIEVGGLVYDLTNRSKIECPTANRAERKRIDRDRISFCNRPVKLIKLCDRIDNLREMGDAPRSFKELYANESLLLLDALAGTDPVLEADLKLIANKLLESKPCVPASLQPYC